MIIQLYYCDFQN